MKRNILAWKLWSKSRPTKAGAYWLAGWWPPGRYKVNGMGQNLPDTDGVFEPIGQIVNLSIEVYSAERLDDLDKGENLVCEHGYDKSHTIWAGPVTLPRTNDLTRRHVEINEET